MWAVISPQEVGLRDTISLREGLVNKKRVPNPDHENEVGLREVNSQVCAPGVFSSELVHTICSI
jgi:hypothetical protein